ncbi:MAG: hypothetical protein N2Z84_00840 [Atribacterota bacterium]|nr:hypothetical protein [Atribacterota bacterium]
MRKLTELEGYLAESRKILPRNLEELQKIGENPQLGLPGEEDF